MANLVDTGDRTLEIARQLRTVVEATCRTLDVSRDLVARSRGQGLPDAVRPALRADDPGPTPELVNGLIRAYELAQDDGDPQTQTLLGCTLAHVGCRIAAGVMPRAAGVAIH